MHSTLHVTFCGRTFTAQEVELMRTVAQDYAGLGVTEISRTICELLEWRRPSGGLKNHECRLLLEQLAERGWLDLPPGRCLGRRGPRAVNVSSQSDAEPELQGSVGDFLPLPLELVGAGVG